MNAKPMSEAKTIDFHGIEAALTSAAAMAQAVAKQFNTPLIVREDGQLMKIEVH